MEPRGAVAVREHSGSGGDGLQERKSGKGPETKLGVWKEARGKMPRELRPAERQGWSGKKETGPEVFGLGVWRDRVVIYMHAEERARLTPAAVGTGEGGQLQRPGDKCDAGPASGLQGCSHR